MEAGDLVALVSDRARTRALLRVVTVNSDETVTVYGGEPPAWRTVRLTAVTTDGLKQRERLAFEQRTERQAELAARIPRPRGRLRT